MFKVGDTAFIILNNMNVIAVTIIKVNGNLYIVRFANGGGTQLPKSRLYPTKEEAESHITNKIFTADKEHSDRYKYNAQLL